jgi:TetR/AcrR family transcriptional regulator, transcriptional repressor of bet genes
MGPIRREQICRAAATVISKRGFAGTTMRMVADEAGVSTGMLNHYFTNRMDMLLETLVFVSIRQQAREMAAIENVPAGEERLRALIRANLPTGQETMEAWRVWIAAYGASGSVTELSRVLADRNDLGFEIVATALEGIVESSPRDKVPYPSQFDAMMTGLVMQVIATETHVSFTAIEEVLVEAALQRGGSGLKQNGRSHRTPKPAARRAASR